MNRRKKNFKILTFVLLVCIGFISIAYALLSSTLTITFNKVTQNAITWIVRFKKPDNGYTVSATASSYNDNTTGLSCGDATINNSSDDKLNQLSVTVAETHLSKPGDRCVWALTVENIGSIEAKLKTVTANKGSNTCSISGSQLTCGKIIYILATNSNCTTKLTSGSTLAPSNGTKNLYLCAYYPEDATELATGLPITQSGVSYTLVYEQN